MATSTWTFGPSRAKRPNPGEPLFTVAELAVKLNIDANRLRALMGRHPGLTAWGHSNGNKAAPYRNYYRLSDAKKWWRQLKDEKR